MKRKLYAAALLLLSALTLAACVQKEQTPQGSYRLYYAAQAEAARGADAIAECGVEIAGEGCDTQELARRLIEALLQGSADARYLSPFPSGTQLQELSLSGGRAHVDFSANYGRLSGIELSLADYCVALTLTQLDGVSAVTITADGHEIPYRRTQLLTAADPLLGSREDTLRPITVQLYFLDTQTNELRAQQQTLALYEGQPRVNALLEALLAGPENDVTLAPLLGADFSVLSARIEDNTCYLNLPSDVPLPESAQEQRLAMTSLVRSLCSLAGVERVQVLVDGEVAQTLGALTVSEPLYADRQL